MPNEQTIQDYLDAILEATYGQQVRTSIYNAIAACYSDVSSGTTAVAEALEEIETVINDAQTAIDGATSAVQSANSAQQAFATAESRYNDAYTLSNGYITQMTNLLNQAIESAEEVETSVSEASESASGASESASLALQYLNELRTYQPNEFSNWRNEVLEALDDANDAASAAADSATSASGSLSSINTSLSIINGQISQINAWYDSIDGWQAQISDDTDTIRVYKEAINDYRNDLTAIQEYFTDAKILELDTRVTEAIEVSDEIGSRILEVQSYVESLDQEREVIQNYATRAETATNNADQIKVNVDNSYADIERWYNAINELGLDTLAESVRSDILECQQDIEGLGEGMTTIEQRISNVDSILDAMDELNTQASANADRAEAAATSLSEATDNANAAAESANSMVNTMTSIQSNWNVVSSSITSNMTTLTSLIQTANDAAANAQEAYDEISPFVDIITPIANEWATRRETIDVYLTDMQSATDAIDNMTVTSESVPYNTSSSVTITNVDDHKNIHFALQKGEPGPGNIIKGDVYETLQDLENDISDPDVGDQYNVGTSAPYNVYRWTGTIWENEGPYGVRFEDISNQEIDTIYGVGTVPSGSKYLNMSGLVHLIRDKIQTSLEEKVDVVVGKGLSTNDFTNQYKAQVDTNTQNISDLQIGKVNVVTGKGLSTNDFTNLYKNRVDTNVNSIATLSSSKLNADFSSFLSYNGNEWVNGLFVIRQNDAMYKISGQDLVTGVASLGSFVRSYDVATLSEAESYLGL